ncbi:MAG: orotidine-5'-phosphate decarboxylase [Flavobacteriaceae bacterium]|jgi:orotidine-5'-phosphate decarboxylase|nr:orotidine-5'-phosphate decarboxylase [Flavobacteriaceae bacterium]MDO7581711.1 orotidine-5'-phosphate decarboxylase [Flavobacteriaceae bacterium]MDO7591451.1 orotidine-5'-phosphate decarboxylase [Flavobacteriaceae bacterium]MDO7598582.1 orotidine-5'-phosphate decarboxylase [Flavobacteriaceae bacterium]MDO7603207.1 orotidine-5'-phosphate decarboxylase [Flavobacteriaceae bacterium]
MRIEALKKQILAKKSFLCVGLDIDLEKVPEHIKTMEDPLYEFSKAIIDSTASYAVAYKPNIAFFETYGPEGMASLKRVMDYLNNKHPEIFTIADAKRGDIGNTATRYAKAYFETYNFDSITIAPYMGKDSVEPFLSFDEKYAILLALTSNGGSSDFQTQQVGGQMLYEKVIQTSVEWQGSERLMYVVGATKANALRKIRELIPNSFLLIPGVGAQGGSLTEVAENGLSIDVGLLVNSSRGIIYASTDENFAREAEKAARELQSQMETILKNKNYI